ncbi:Asp23/Gls24 family envelope stress response protein [Nocardiopsis trehalosi]|uniref:Asp23/Gls24 family envelope stress response protein n=1 Tax=Nocardiopsis trehalosi TaxID=109329 RepID=UPI000829AD45|nr:Asp23/Gls24 family envelope stress response protein [Nocardiopsis trehalosi]
MTATEAPPTGGPRQRAPLAPPADRGATVIRDGVIGRIAARAAAEVDGVVAVRTRRVAGVGGGRGAPARVRVRTSGRYVFLALEIAVAYPRPARRVARDVRVRVMERVGHLTGRSVRHIDIEIVELRRARRAH